MKTYLTSNVKTPEGREIIVVGDGLFSKLISYYITNETNCKIAAYVVENDYISKKIFLGKPVVPFEDVQYIYPPKQYDMVIGIGYFQMNYLRKRLFLQSKKKGYYIANVVHNSAVIANNSMIGEGNIIMEHVVVQPFVSMGNGNLFWYGAMVGHDSTIGSFNMVASHATLLGNTILKDQCFIGAGAIVQENRTISDGTLLGAGSVCKKNTMPFQVLVPARSVILENKKSTEYL